MTFRKMSDIQTVCLYTLFIILERKGGYFVSIENQTTAWLYAIKYH